MTFAGMVLVRALTAVVLLLPPTVAAAQALDLGQQLEHGITATETRFDSLPYPLKPPDLDSPRATIRSFLTSMNDAIQRYRTEEPSESVRRALRRALLALDLEAVPAATREEIGIEKALLLKEVLDRVVLPPAEDIPGRLAVTEQGLTRYTIPNTEITLTEREEGPRAGAFLFSQRTVENAEEYYDLAEALPYKPGATIGAYEDYLYGPGSLIPRRWVEGFPSWAYIVVLDNTAWQWIGVAAIAGAAVMLALAVCLWGRRWDRRREGMSARSRFGQPLAATFVILLTPFVTLLLKDAVNLTGQALVASQLALSAVRYAAIAWLVALIISRIGESFINAQDPAAPGINRQLIRIIVRLVIFVIVVYVAVDASTAFGIPIEPLIAGLGVSGLAVALAVRPTLENIIGGFTLFADKPVKVGDFCAYGDKVGTVEQIGLRSTRVRSLDRTIVTVPNAEFSQMQLVNFASRDMMLFKIIVGLRYETTPDQLRYVLAKVREMLLGHPRVTNDPARIRFLEFGAYSLDLEIFAYVNSKDWGEYLGIREDLNLRIMDIVAEAGTGFAFPSQTNYFARDSGLDDESGRQAEAAVEAWRDAGRLPFPDFDKGTQWEIQDILEFPPKGSPEYAPRRGLCDPSPQPSPPDPKAPRSSRRR